MDLTQQILRMKELKMHIDELDDAKKELTKEYDKLRLFDVPNSMAENGDVRSITGEFGRCTLTADLSVSVLNKPKLHTWLEESGNGPLIVPTVNSQTLKAFTKEMMQKGEDLPEDILKISPFVRAVLYSK